MMILEALLDLIRCSNELTLVGIYNALIVCILAKGLSLPPAIHS